MVGMCCYRLLLLGKGYRDMMAGPEEEPSYCYTLHHGMEPPMLGTPPKKKWTRIKYDNPIEKK